MSWRLTGRPEAPPLVCAGRVQNAMRLTALDEAAEALGLKPMQGLAEAKAICPPLDVAMADEAADARFLAAIADWCDRYTPLVAIDGRAGLFLDITGCAHLFGGEDALLQDVLARLKQFGLDARGAIAASPGLSCAIARHGGGGVIGVEEAEAALTPLPLDALRLSPDTVARLARLGLRQVGDLLALPRAPLTRRFGPDVVLRLDQALGQEDEPISPRRPLARLSVERKLAEPVTGEEDLMALSAKLAVALKPQLETHGLGGRLFELLLFRVDGQVFRLHAGASSPLREPKRIAALFSERFQAVHDDLDAGFGFELLRLNVLHADTFAGAQQDFSGSSDGAASLDAFIDQTVARFGADCLLLPVAHESHLPERAGLLRPAFQAGATQAVSQNHAPLRLERPFRLFARPELMEAIAPVPDGPPILFRWRRTQHQVRRAEGPERIGAEWWVDGETAPPRDYFRIEDEAGRRYWLFREGLYGETPPRWFMHGVFA
ncbi:DNA polymerase Y family protein [Rhizobium sp. YJ-22]|uniref:Y-family DNA polymerase n=1 Tax=Rhizobium sp. YJ-22 TaxID=3037556 RepID=UPI0024124CCB|nr:DNA polymerase Y family protein [Rhizobium sp. YJ-22]MDG3577596.1 DNA polymerase Y family protein [Rhizobium sp. YJ-22]